MPDIHKVNSRPLSQQSLYCLFRKTVDGLFLKVTNSSNIFLSKENSYMRWFHETYVSYNTYKFSAK